MLHISIWNNYFIFSLVVSITLELPAPKSSDDVSSEPEMIVVPSEKELSLREKPPAQSTTLKKTKKLIQLPSLPSVRDSLILYVISPVMVTKSNTTL